MVDAIQCLTFFYCVGKIHIGNPLHSVHAGYTRSKGFIRAGFINA